MMTKKKLTKKQMLERKALRKRVLLKTLGGVEAGAAIGLTAAGEPLGLVLLIPAASAFTTAKQRQAFKRKLKRLTG